MEISLNKIIEITKEMANIQEMLISLINEELDIDSFLTFFRNRYTKSNNKKYFLNDLLNLIKSVDKSVLSTTKKSVIYQILTKLSVEIEQNFTEENLFSLYQNNEIILLYLLENHIISIEMIRKNINYYWNKYFFPELLESNKILFFQFYSKNRVLNDKSNIINDYLTNISEFKIYRHENHSEDPIARLIRNDQIDTFIDTFEKMKIDLFSYKIKQSFFENQCIFYNVDLINYAAGFGSLQIFKYLLMKKVKINKSIHKYAIIGGNYEIIHILEENNIEFNSDSITTAIQYNQNEILNYLHSTIGLNFEKIHLLICFEFFNYFALNLIFSENPEFFDLNEIGNNVFYESCKTGFITLSSFLINQRFIDVNYLYKILKIFYSTNGVYFIFN